MRAISDDELAIACPQCDAGEGEPCQMPDGEDRKAPHARRVKAAERHAAELERALAEHKRKAEAEAPERIGTLRFRRVYVAARLELEQRAAWTRMAAEQLEMCVRNMEAADKARTDASKRPLVEGSTGQPVTNPLWALAVKLDAQALITARTLKLTPDTRGTSASVQDDGADLDDERPAVELDELAVLDELARKRKAKAAK